MTYVNRYLIKRDVHSMIQRIIERRSRDSNLCIEVRSALLSAAEKAEQFSNVCNSLGINPPGGSPALTNRAALNLFLGEAA
jgi:hypothetical protein